MNSRRASFCRANFRLLIALLLAAFAIGITFNIFSSSNQPSVIELIASNGQDDNKQELELNAGGEQLKLLGDEERDNFVWCDKIRDWALLRLPSSINKSRRQDWLADSESISEKTRKASSSDCIWPPDESTATNGSRCLDSADRIINQLKLDVADGSEEQDLHRYQNRKQRQQQLDDDGSFVRIAIDSDSHNPLGQSVFLRDNCRVNKCLLTDNLHEAQAIIFKNSDLPISGGGSGGGAWAKWPRLATSELRSRQIWIAYLLESPPNTFDKRFVRQRRSGKHHLFNWTATYRSDSDIVTPYSKFVPYLDTIDQFISLKRRSHPSSGSETLQSQIGGTRSEYWPGDDDKLVARIRGNKRRQFASVKVAWLVSNCHSHNNRLEYARELSKYVQVDVYGKCGNMTCSKSAQATCLQHLNHNYKFYLAFENSNSREYITEKLYHNGYGYNDQNHLLLPIVMGAPRQDYERLVPPGSFIHVDDFASSQELANYLKLLNSNDRLYASYFRWKSLGRFIDTKFLCRVCALAHETIRSQGRGKGVKTYNSISDWWWLGEKAT